jgi:hypothetical protein
VKAIDDMLINHKVHTTILQSGIHIHTDDTIDLTKRISLSLGTEEPSVESKASYSKEAVLPVDKWRKPTGEELELLTECKNKDLQKCEVSSTIFLFRVPESISLLINQLPFSDVYSKDDYEIIHLHSRYDLVIQEVADALAPFSLDSQAISPRGVYINQANLRTTTSEPCENSPNNCFTGLHLDSWYPRPLIERHLSRNRICINLGQDTRFFLFVNLTLVEMYEKLGFPLKESERFFHFGSGIGHAFLKRFPNYPVVRIKLDPGEAYIAPTEFMIHDGSSIGSSHPDITLTYLGYFRFSDNCC